MQGPPGVKQSASSGRVRVWKGRVGLIMDYRSRDLIDVLDFTADQQNLQTLDLKRKVSLPLKGQQSLVLQILKFLAALLTVGALWMLTELYLRCQLTSFSRGCPVRYSCLPSSCPHFRPTMQGGLAFLQKTEFQSFRTGIGVVF